MKKAFSLIEVIIVFAICIVLIGFIFPYLWNKKLTMNDALAQKTLNLLSVVVDKYSMEHQNQFPVSIDELRQIQIDSLNREFCGQTFSGFIYECDFSPQGYILKAKPSHPGWSGTQTFSVMTDGMVAK